MRMPHSRRFHRLSELKSASALSLLPLAALASAASAQTTPVFTSGNVVVAVEGCGVQGGSCTAVINGTGTGAGNSSSGGYGDNQAAPLTLFQFKPIGTASVTFVNSLVLPQTPTGANLPIAGEYGSSSEGTLQLSGTGQYLTIGAYGINAATFDASPTTYGAAPSNALAQSGSLTGQAYTPVARIVTLIDPYGNVNSSSAYFNIFNTNNPRSVYTATGASVYLSGQGSGSDATGGVFYSPLFVTNNAPAAITGLDTTSNTISQDTRTVQIYNGTLYVSADTKGGSGSTRSFIGTLGTPPATSLYMSNAGPTQLPFYNNAATPVAVTSNGKITLTASETNGLNATGQQVNLSASNFFFANASTLYVADTGNSKQTSATSTLGDGGLQKWVNTKSDGTGNWQLLYTVSAGLNLVANPTNTPANTSGTTGLYGLTGVVSGGNVYLYATNATIADLDTTYLYGFTDTLSATTNPGTSFVKLATAPADSNFKGVALAPTLPAGSATITSVPSGLSVTTAGTGCMPGTYITPVTLIWTPGTSCSLSTTTPQTAQGTPYVFSQWQDGTTSTTDTVSAPATAAIYTATFTNTFQPMGVLEKAQDNTTNSTTVQQGDSLLVSGWAADPVDGSPLANIKVYIDGTLFGTPTTGISRPDVAAAYNNPAYTNSGYQLVMSSSALTLGSHSVTVIAIDVNNRSTTFGPLTINVTAASKVVFTMAPAASITAGGNAGMVTVALQNASGATTATSMGSVTLTVTGPGTYAQTYTANTTNGVASFALSTPLTAAGTYTYTASSTGVTSTTPATETVQAGAATSFLFTNLTGETQPGVTQNVTVQAVDAYNNPIPSFGGAVTFTSTDLRATLPAPYTYTGADAGSHVFSLALNTGGTFSVTATSGTLTGTQAGIVIGDAIWVLNASDQLVRLTDVGVQTTTAGGTSGTSTTGQVAFDNAGDVWATQADRNSFVELSATGTQMATGANTAGLNFPVALFIDGLGQAWIANRGNGSISVISAAGTSVSPATGYQPGALSTPTGLVIDSSGSVWITNSGANTVTKIIGAANPVTTPTATATGNNTLGTRP